MSSLDIVTLRIELLHTSPLIWRQLEVPVSATLEAVHHIVQAAMGWSGAHLWEFEMDGRRYALANEDGEAYGEPAIDAASTTLARILTPGETRIDYRYDFGDDWVFRLTLSAPRPRAAATAYPRYIGGERNAPPEDFGGPAGVELLVYALDNPTDPEVSDMVEWARGYDPESIDEASIRSALARIAT